MRYAVLFALLAMAAPALADPNRICIDARDHNRYNAQPLSRHEVIARNAIGAEKRAARLTTTCIHIYRDSFVALHSFTKCLDKGDEVGVSTFGGRREQCKVTGVTPAAQSYADAKYSYDYRNGLCPVTAFQTARTTMAPITATTVEAMKP